MGDGLDFVGILFMIVALVLSIYQAFYSKTAKEMVLEVSEKMTPRSLAGIIQYLILIALNTYFAHMLFDITWMLWITLVSIIGLEIILAEKRFSKSLILATGLMLLFIYSSSIPTHSDSFTDYINDKTEYQCFTLECVKVIEKITSDDLLQTEVNTFFDC